MFKFRTRGNDVALVSKKDSKECNDGDPLWYQTIGSACYRIKSHGNYYITVAHHSEAGQKAINSSASHSQQQQ